MADLTDWTPERLRALDVALAKAAKGGKLRPTPERERLWMPWPRALRAEEGEEGLMGCTDEEAWDREPEPVKKAPTITMGIGEFVRRTERLCGVEVLSPRGVEEARVLLREALAIAAEVDGLKCSLEQTRAAMEAGDVCTVCGGTGKPVSGKPCICGGHGGIGNQIIGLTREAQKERERAEKAEALLREAVGLLEQSREYHPYCDELPNWTADVDALLDRCPKFRGETK